MVAEAERRHAQFDEPIEALSVFYGKHDRPSSWQLNTRKNSSPLRP
jgi:hypothetical protein